jgi:hypothetical protein
MDLLNMNVEKHIKNAGKNSLKQQIARGKTLDFMLEIRK